MRFARRSRSLLGLVLMAPGLSGCDLSAITALGDMFSPHLVSVNVSGENAVSVRDSIRLRATGGLDGLYRLLVYDPLEDAKWSSSDPSIAQVVRPPPSPDDTLYSSAIVVGIRPGRVSIEASARGISGSRVVTVTRIVARPSFDRR